MSLWKSLSAIAIVAVCLAVSARDAAAQRGGGGAHAHGGGAHVSGGAVHAAGPRPGAPATVGHAVPRPGYPGYPSHPVYGHPGYPYYGYGYRPYYPYYGYGYPYYGYPGFSIGIGFGFGYGYGYGYYGYPYYGYAYPGYTYAAPVYVNPGSGGSGGGGYVEQGNQTQAYGGVRIQGAPSDAQVYADGYFVGAVSDFNGSQQQLSLPAGVHKIEVRSPGQPPVEFDVNIQAGQTVTYRVGR
jgi:hypothetical protein